MTDFQWTDLENADPAVQGSGDYVTVEPINAMGHEVERLRIAKQDTEQGKGLSSNDFTTEEKTKLSEIATGAEVNVIETVKVDGSALTPTDKSVNIDLSGKVNKTQKIAGVDLQDDISKLEMQTALNIENVDNTSDLNKPVSNPTMETLCPQTETTSLTIADAVPRNVIDYTIYGASGGVGDLVVEGDDDYAEYGGKYRIPIKVSGVNLIDTTEFEGNYTEGSVINAGNGTFTVRGSAIYDQSISGKLHQAILDKLEVGKTYYAKWDIVSGTPHWNFLYVYGEESNNEWYNGGTHTITQAEKEHNIGVAIYGSNNGNEDVVYANFIISEVNAPFEPYTESQTVNVYLDEPLGAGESVSLSDTNVPIQLSQYTNNIEFGTEVQPSRVEIKYYQDINALKHKAERLETDKQDTLVSGENIKTINGENILGNGDLSILAEKSHELIHKYITGYSITTSEPSDWATNYGNYYTNTGTAKEPVYTIVTDATTPTWQSGTYYERVSIGSGFVWLNEYSTGFNYNFDKLYVHIRNYNSDNSFPTSYVEVYAGNTIITKFLTNFNVGTDGVWWFEEAKKTKYWEMFAPSGSLMAGNTGSKQNLGIPAVYNNAVNNKITGFRIYSTDIIPDVEIEVWGVR